MEGVPHQHRRAYGTEAYAKTLLHPAHIEDYEQYEISDKTSGEDEKILRFQSLVFHRPAYALVNRIFHYRHGLEEERAQDCGRDHKKDTGTEPRCGGLARVGIAGAEFAIDLDTAYKTDDCADGID